MIDRDAHDCAGSSSVQGRRVIACGVEERDPAIRDVSRWARWIAGLPNTQAGYTLSLHGLLQFKLLYRILSTTVDIKHSSMHKRCKHPLDTTSKAIKKNGPRTCEPHLSTPKIHD